MVVCLDVIERTGHAVAHGQDLRGGVTQRHRRTLGDRRCKRFRHVLPPPISRLKRHIAEPSSAFIFVHAGDLAQLARRLDIIAICDQTLAEVKRLGKFPPPLVESSPAKTFARFGAADWDARRTAFRDEMAEAMGAGDRERLQELAIQAVARRPMTSARRPASRVAPSCATS